jgi:hypothetical protein
MMGQRSGLGCIMAQQLSPVREHHMPSPCPEPERTVFLWTMSCLVVIMCALLALDAYLVLGSP